jgi:SAM-dependent methyltransferase
MSILDFDLKKEIAKKLKTNKEITIVDIGCGVGRSLWELSNIFSESEVHMNLFGVFYSAKPNPNSIFFANQKRYEEVLKNPLIVANEFNIQTKNKDIPKLFNTDACKYLPIKSNSVDLIYSTNAFHFFADKINAIKEMSRILKTNGIAIINIDRTDDDFWPDNLHFPRLCIHREHKIIDAKKFLQSKSGADFTISIKKVDSYGTGKNSYILKMRKHQKKTLTFPELSFDKKESFSLDNIRFSEQNCEDTIEYKRLIAMGTVFGKKTNKENFGGYLSTYKLKE